MSSAPDVSDLAEPHVQRHRHLLERRRRAQFLRAIAVGAAAGGLAVLFLQALQAGETVRGHLVAFLKLHPAWGWSSLPAAAGLLGAVAAWITGRLAPEASGSGIPHVKGVLMHVRTLQWQRLLPVKFVGGVLAIGSGFSLGREGPSVQMGAAAGNVVGDLLRVPQRERRHLVACGAGAGLAAAFNAPLAGFLFVIEELQRELSPITYGTALIACVVADVVARAFTGQHPSFHVHSYPMAPLAALPLFAVLGAAAGVLGAGFNHGLLWSQHRFQHSRLPGWARAGLVGVVVGFAVWWVPQAVGGGHGTAESMLRGDYAGKGLLGFLLLLLVAKFVLTLLSYASGVPGGIFAPLLLLGATLGLIVGECGATWFPVLAHTPAVFAVVGMGALFTATVRAPVTGVVLILEMTANYEQLLPLLVASLLALVVAEHLGAEPIYEALLDADLERKGLRPPKLVEPTLVHVAVEDGSLLVGRSLRTAGLPEGCLVVTVQRGGIQIVPDGDTQLLAGDLLIIMVSGTEAEHYAEVVARARAAG